MTDLNWCDAVIRIIARYWDWFVAALAGVCFATAVAALSGLIHIFWR
jgi:presenilin-like A22 family membrane protease